MFRYCWVWLKTRPTGFANAKKQPLRCAEDVVVFYDRPPMYNPQGIVRINKLCKNSSSCGGDTVRSSVAESAGKGSMRTAGKEYLQEFTNYPRQTLEFAHDTATAHPTQKPVALMEYLICTYTNEGELVLDNTAGSFTTGVAAFRTGRKFIGIERDPDYFKIGVCRLCDEARALSLCGTTDRDILSWKVDWPFQEIQNPYTALCDELVSKGKSRELKTTNLRRDETTTRTIHI